MHNIFKHADLLHYKTKTPVWQVCNSIFNYQPCWFITLQK